MPVWKTVAVQELIHKFFQPPLLDGEGQSSEARVYSKTHQLDQLPQPDVQPNIHPDFKFRLNTTLTQL